MKVAITMVKNPVSIILEEKLTAFLAKQNTERVPQEVRRDIERILACLNLEGDWLPAVPDEPEVLPPPLPIETSEGRANQIAQIRAAEDIDYLKDTFGLEAADREIRCAALETLMKVGKLSDVESLLDDWLFRDDWAKVLIINKLGEIGNESTATKIKTCLDPNGDERAKLAAVHALCKIGGRGVTYVIIFLNKNIFPGQLEDGKLKLAEEAALALGETQDEQAIEVLIRLLEYKSEYPGVVKNSIIALGKIGYSKGLEKVLPILEGNGFLKDPEVMTALRNLVKCSELSPTEILNQSWGNPHLFPLAAQVLAEMMDERSPELIDEARDSEVFDEGLRQVMNLMREKIVEAIQSKKTEPALALESDVQDADAVGWLASLKNSKYLKAAHVISILLGGVGAFLTLLTALDSLTDGAIKKWIWGERGKKSATGNPGAEPKKTKWPARKKIAPAIAPFQSPKVRPGKVNSTKDDSSEDDYH